MELVVDEVLPSERRDELARQLGVSPALASLRLCQPAAPSGQRRAIVLSHAEGQTFHLAISSGASVIAERFLSLTGTEPSAHALTIAIAIDELVRANPFPVPHAALSPPYRPATILAPVRVDPAAPRPKWARIHAEVLITGLGDALLESATQLELRWEIWGPLELSAGVRVGAVFGESEVGRVVGGCAGPRLGARLVFDGLVGPVGVEVRSGLTAPVYVLRGRPDGDPFVLGRTDTGFGLDADFGLAFPVRVGTFWIGPFAAARVVATGLSLAGAEDEVLLFERALTAGLQLTWW